ncbi:Stress response protein ish1 [Fulvia fulva]|uniref:Stress response protein ish1 n=1 Tax=Passalora fulva TaxID=5499 RepID=A0A9Q8PC87_PASFU|nr:Stress response protein ish1 [Fulvia fulva]KAK4619440.1 Stress response protein ish1 [Fulvia fulva]KAK4620486.1 Stress response protein ish1 [Fulvia fulva]UJO19790.1 Stress response protein ish1 [Fulvia fulva]WPV17260.1 Stress response protein ish1 [Fulvia fulva]WPV32344.1 Stress response protein ish1 [Fulvia fulva]
MKLSLASLALACLATQATADWFGKAAYDKWHETELERWLSDHNVPYPAASDRKDLQELVKKNWENNVVKPYNSWDVNQLQSYLGSKGQEVKKGTEKNKDSLIQQVQSYWYQTTDQANDAYYNVEHWIFDTWTESQLKQFLDKHNIPNPNPRTRDSLVSTARSNYHKVAEKAGETAAYPGNWLYDSWSDSDLKAWLDERGVPVPQPSTRDKLIASLRRNSKIASDRAKEQYASAAKSAESAQQSLSDQLLESWSDSEIKAWCDKYGIPVPQGSKRNELIALARKHSQQAIHGNTASSASKSAASAYGAATSSAGNYYAQATDDAYSGFRYYYDVVANQLGFASAEASASLSSASSVASRSLSSASSTGSIQASKSSIEASKSASSASIQASKNAKSGASEASKSAQSGASAASKSAQSAASVAKGKAKSATDQAKAEL